MKGKLITFEGIEGAGKTVQVKKLAEYLGSKGKKVLVVREPGGTVIGEAIRKVVLGNEQKELFPLTELFLFLASRAQLCKEVILLALKQGKIVLCDRFADSSLAYQAGGRGLDSSLVARLNKIATSGLVPDLTILLDLPTKIALKRRRKNYKNDVLPSGVRPFFECDVLPSGVRPFFECDVLPRTRRCGVIPPSRGLRRAGRLFLPRCPSGRENNRLDGENERFYQKVRTTYLRLAKKEPQRWVIVDGSESIEKVHQQIVAKVLGKTLPHTS